ncbi:MAG: DUF1643 domain-containing protein [Acidobacteria bacterium]|nr:DUF1643 domain-containing protein [Acidobacteriota bacterium]MYK87083.1 DUF1643 domain-containing protein [Acidobacteriota bacterium]
MPARRTPDYRYTLERDLGGLLAPRPKHVLVCGLNPSTADAERDDPTSRRVIGFARREEATRLTMVNLYAARTTDPKGLKDFDDPVGAGNDAAIAGAANDADLIIAAWGRPPDKAGRARARRVLNLLTAAGNVYRLGPATKEGHPPHPLYLPKSGKRTPIELHAASTADNASGGRRVAKSRASACGHAPVHL